MPEKLKLALKLAPSVLIAIASTALLYDFGLNESKWVGSEDGPNLKEAITALAGYTAASWGAHVVLRSQMY